jgi:hypothetical protein
MSKQRDRIIAGFTSGERDYIRRELDVFFSTLPSVTEGFHLKTWRGGPEAGKPKLPPTALREMMADPRIADPKKFAHVRQELGIDPVSADVRD